MILVKLIVKNKEGKVRRVRLKFIEPKTLDQLRECVEFPDGWFIHSFVVVGEKHVNNS